MAVAVLCPGSYCFFNELVAESLFDLINGLIELEFFNIIFKKAHLHGKGYELAEADAE